jgi:SAM-dependent methyltransferase
MREIDISELHDGSALAEEHRPRTIVAATPTAPMDCDRVARFYRVAEYLVFGGALQACRVMFLGEVTECRSALVCGDGDGRFLGELLRRNSVVRVDSVELSAGMAELAKRRIEAIEKGAAARTRFQVGDIREFQPGDTVRFYDLITTHFVLDCFDDAELVNVTRRLASFAKPGACLVLSDFRIPPRGLRRYLARAIVRVLYAAFRFSTGLRVTRLADYEGALERAGFRKDRETLKLGGLLIASLWRKI